jgi:4-hydroxybenzoate polyprenyltransferase
MSLLQTVVTYGRMIKFSHSIFALPFALSGAALAASRHGFTSAQIGWVVVAMVGARSAAMGFNRLADRHLDAANPRTAQRELPRGAVAPLSVVLLVALSSAALVFAAWMLNPLCFYLSPAVLAVLFFYSFTKRFTWACHLVLGLSLGGAPVGAWVAIAGGFAWPPLLLGLAVLCWVAGFDIFYACQDYDFDADSGLHSIPVRFGLETSMGIARLLHLMAVGFMLGVGYLTGLQGVFYLGVALIAGLLLYEHRLVRPDDLSRVNIAFATMNAVISVVFFLFTVADLLILGDGILWSHGALTQG